MIDNIISSSPGLYQDSVAIAMLLDADLMAHFTNVDTVKRYLKISTNFIHSIELQKNTALLRRNIQLDIPEFILNVENVYKN